MNRILALCSPGEVRVAAVADGTLLDYGIWRPGRPDGVGDLYRGRVLAHAPALAGAFVALPLGDGFLPDSEGGAGLVAGAPVTVRITRAAQGGKGPRLSAQAPQSPGSPGLIARGPSLVEVFASHYPEAPIHADDPALAAELRPCLGDRISITRETLDDRIAEQIEALARPDVALPGGMRASIHPTPALVAIDMDMAEATGLRQSKAAAQFAANKEALPELARQIRLRNLGGAILVDLAGMGAKRRAALQPALTEALAGDPLHPRLLGFTALGLAEIVRPRVRPPLHELLAGPHAAGLAALRQIAGENASVPHVSFGLRAAPDVLAALESDLVAVPDLARRTGGSLTRIPDPALPSGHWLLERR